MVILGFMIGLALGYGIIAGFYQPEIFRLQDEITVQTKGASLDPLMFYLADTSLYYIGQNHPEASTDIPSSVVWQGGRVTPEGSVGHETYQYRGEGWTVTIEWSVVALEHLTYTVTVEHNGMMWSGEVSRGVITELGYER
jgi:hypothetical protein